MARVRAGNIKIPTTTDGFALRTDFFYGCSDSHNDKKRFAPTLLSKRRIKIKDAYNLFTIRNFPPYGLSSSATLSPIKTLMR